LQCRIQRALQTAMTPSSNTHRAFLPVILRVAALTILGETMRKFMYDPRVLKFAAAAAGAAAVILVRYHSGPLA
jgi:hypothetical protein